VLVIVESGGQRVDLITTTSMGVYIVLMKVIVKVNTQLICKFITCCYQYSLPYAAMAYPTNELQRRGAIKCTSPLHPRVHFQRVPLLSS